MGCVCGCLGEVASARLTAESEMTDGLTERRRPDGQRTSGNAQCEGGGGKARSEAVVVLLAVFRLLLEALVLGGLVLVQRFPLWQESERN